VSKTKNATLAQNIQTSIYKTNPYLKNMDTYEFKFDYFCPFCAVMHQGREISQKLPTYVGYLRNCSAPNTINVYFPKE